MLPENNEELKLMMTEGNYDRYVMSTERLKYEPQFVRNTLQLNMGDNRYSEVGQLSGIHDTHWSWAPLMVDFDNDGLKDIMITNGYPKNVIDLDYVNYMGTEGMFGTKESIREKLTEKLESLNEIKLPNYFYKNHGNAQFEDVSQAWGFTTATVSNGAAYGDFDQDGDIDLVGGNLGKNYKYQASETETFDLFVNDSGDSSLQLFSTKINSHKDEGSFSLFDQGNQIIFSRNESIASRKNKTKLYHAVWDKKKGKWRKPKVLVLGSVDFAYAHPVVSLDGEVLFFSSNMEGTIGGADIFKSEWKDGYWTTPKHLNSVINTKGDEFPSYCDSNGVLYFSSNGINGEGNHDIFKAIPKGDNFEILTFEAPINSIYDEFGFTMNEDKTFLASNRAGGKGGFDIYELVEKELPINEKTRIMGEEEVTEEKLLVSEVVDVIKSYNGSDSKSKTWFVDKNGRFLTEDKDEIKAKFLDKTLQIDKVYLFTSVYYELNQSNISPGEIGGLNKLVEMLHSHTTMKVVLKGYTDNTGSKKINESLRRNRTTVIRDYLISENISPERKGTPQYQ